MAEPANFFGPDRPTRPPTFTLPTGACDCHAHVFGPYDRYPLPPNPTYRPPPTPWTEYLQMLRNVGCSRAVLVQPSPYGADHSALLASLTLGEIPLRGIALIDRSITKRQLEEFSFFGVKGVRRHLLASHTNQALHSLPVLAERIRSFGWHIQLYVEAGLLPALAQLLPALPVQVVIDHFGLIPAESGVDSPAFTALQRCLRSGRCWVKLSAPCRISSQPPSYADAIPLAHALLETAPDFCLWGTDWPHPNVTHVSNDGDLVDLLPRWIPDQSLRHKILVENPQRLYGF